jgi:hypothetical protein
MRHHRAWRLVALLTVATLVAALLAIVAVPAGAASGPAGSNATLAVEAPGVSVLKKGAQSFAKA